jgi:hypothetical protein
MDKLRGAVKDPREYINELQEMYLDESELNLSNDFLARASLVKLERLKSEVLDLKLVVSKDMRIIRNMYLDESIIAKPKILGLIRYEKKLSPTKKRKKLLDEREKSLIPYKEIIILIDDYIKQIEDYEKYIRNEALEKYSVPKYTKFTKSK